MRLTGIACILILGFCCVKAELEQEGKKPGVTKLEVVDLGEVEADSETKESEVHRRESGYSYNRPHHFALAGRVRGQVGQAGYKGRIINKHPVQIHRPVAKYGPPAHQHVSSMRPGPQSQPHQDNLQQQHGHFNQQHSGNFNNRPAPQLQEVPSPIRQFDFVEPSPIASQNNQPFAPNSANYLPPSNQKLPAYSTPDHFSPQQTLQITQSNDQGHNAAFQSQNNIVQSQEQQISDAALFLSQNADAIQQLYGAAATEQDFAPNINEFVGHSNQVQTTNGQLQNFESSSPNPRPFAGRLPSYASGTLNPHETLQQIQSLEKDRLIVQLQRALAVQSQQGGENGGRYAENQASFVNNQDLLASLGQQMKIQGLNVRPSTLSISAGNTAFNQSPFLPGTTITSAQFPLNYGLTTTTQAPTTSPGVSSLPPQQGGRGDGTSQVGSSLPAPSQPGSASSPPSAGIPVYGGFVPTILTGTSFLGGVPTYGTSLFAPGTVTTTVQSSGSAPTHFGIPIPTETSQKPSTASSVPATPASPIPSPGSPSRPGAPVSPPVSALPFPAHPLTPLHPVSTPFRPVVSPIHPVAPLHPVLPAATSPTYVHPVQTAPSHHPAHPTYGLQTPAAVNPVVLKPVKPVYPLYYYPNVVYQLQKPVLPTYPWNYAPTYAQTKPAQIWK